MKLRAQATLNLPSQEYKTVLEYSTYEQAKWDQYFIATLVNNTNSRDEAVTYLDNLTENGSLNAYFKKLLDDVIMNKEKSPEVFQRLLESSLYPVINLDNSYRWFYLPIFDISLLRRNKKDIAVFPDKLSDNSNKNIKDEQIFKNLLGKNETFISVKNSLVEDELSEMNNLYEVELQDHRVRVKLLNEWFSLSLASFNQALESEVIDLDVFQGKVVNDATGEGWKILSNKDLEVFFSKKNFNFYDQDDENLYLIQDNGLVLIEIYRYSENLYLYRRTFKNYDSENATKTLSFLLNSKAINEIKTKMILSLLNLVDPTLAHKVINEILVNKDSKELAEFGLKLIESGLTSNWNQVVLKKIKTITIPKKMQLIYEIDPSIFNFENESSLILGLSDNTLSQKHCEDKKLYYDNHKKMLHGINVMIGEITASGVREELKILKSNETVKRFKKFLNDIVGHNKKNYREMDLKTLKKEYKAIHYFYSNDYPQVMEMIENKNKK